MSVPVTPDAWLRLGHRIRAERERRGMSRKALAELAGISPGSVQSAEKGLVPRGRWPQTLSAIERALGWSTGSMRSVLDGGDVEYEPSLFDDSTTPEVDTGAPIQGEASLAAKATLTASGEVTPSSAWWVSQFAHLDLPDDLRKALPQVMYFATTAVRHGVDEWAASSFTNIVYLMLDQVSGIRSERARAQRPPVTTLEESEQLLADLEGDRKRLLAGIQAMEAMVDQLPAVPEDQMSAGERENREELAELKKLLAEMEPLRQPIGELRAADEARDKGEN